jgi:hypothetical protein
MSRVILLMAFLFQSAIAFEDWGPVKFLVGNWTGEGSGQPGQGTGKFSFTPDLQGKVLIRKSYAEYPAAQGRPASRHDDLMVVYREESSGWRAMYFDNEGHVISYTVISSGAGAVFTSDGPASGTRYRLTYMPEGKEEVRLRFEIAPPGKEFATYLESSARKGP